MSAKKTATSDEVLRRVIAEVRTRGFRTWDEFLTGFDRLAASEKVVADAMKSFRERQKHEDEAIKQLAAFGKARVDGLMITLNKSAYEEA